MEDNGFLDLSDHDSFANGVPHKTFERIRNEDPVFWTKEKNGRGFWSITKHADILKINRDNKVFSSAQGIRIEDQTEEEKMNNYNISDEIINLNKLKKDGILTDEEYEKAKKKLLD